MKLTGFLMNRLGSLLLEVSRAKREMEQFD